MTHAIVREVRAALAAHADPERAPRMQAYMKSAMPFRGVPSTVQKRLYREIFAEHRAMTCEERRAVARELFTKAKFREERYAALALTDQRRHVTCQSMEAMPLYEEMIVLGAWWDIVDWVAGHHLGDVLRNEPAPMTRRMKRWAKDPHLWKRRAAILCQLRMKEDTDLDLLYACIAPNVANEDFFMRKAIGWALRQYAWTDPREVKRWVTAHRAELSPLSVREALKHVG